jgi:energy-coupling factor transport system ATP-binding protein
VSSPTSSSQSEPGGGALLLEGALFSYEKDGGHPALNGLSLAPGPGKITVLTGPSGCGKSTLLYLLAGLYPKYAGTLLSGSARLGGEDTAGIPPERRALLVGMMFQNPDLQFCMDTVENELIFCLENTAAAPGAMDGKVAAALDFCGITNLRHRKLQTLSGGEKQKAMLACIVCTDPAWLLLDEPFANIDRGSAGEIARKLRQLVDERGKSVVAVDHKLDVWGAVCDEVKVLGAGAGMPLLEGVCPRGAGGGAALSPLPGLGVDIPSRPYRAGGALPPAKPAPDADAAVLLTLEDVSVSAGDAPVISGLSASFEKARIHAILGASGAGKSTLLEAVCGFRKYTGSIRVGGREVSKIPARQIGGNVGFVFQNPQDQFVAPTVLDEVMTGLRFGAQGGQLSKEEKDAEAERVLRAAGLWRYRALSPYMLSQGEQRRLALTALLAYRCRLLVCDEPTYAQDLSSLTGLMDLLLERVRGEGMTLLLSTHDRKLARDYADRAYVLEGGALHAVDRPDL